MQQHSRNVWSAGTTILLPFLYNTRTILTPAFRCPKAPPRRSHKLSTLIPPRSTDSHIPFENLPEDKRDLDNSGSRGTITANERAIFDRIFKNLPQSSLDSQAVADEIFDNEDDEANLSSFRDDDLESLFNDAIEASRYLKPQQPDDRPAVLEQNTSRPPPILNTEPLRILDTEKFPPSLRKAAEQANDALLRSTEHKKKIVSIQKLAEASAINAGLSTPQLDAHQLQVEKAVEEDMVRVRSLLESAQTDVEVWEILTKDVFSLVETMKKQMDYAADRQDAAARPLSTKIRARKTLPQAEPPPFLTSVPALAILQANYARHCLQAMNLFRVHFPTTSYAIPLLFTIKRLGFVSYVLGASTHLYNELLYIRWVHYTDIHGVAKLVDEMIDQGIGVDNLTICLVTDGERYLKGARRGELGNVAKTYLRLQGVKEGWLRWRQVKRRVKQEQFANKWRDNEERVLEEVERAEAEEENTERTQALTEGNIVYSSVNPND